jgi:hypothetical protein
MLRNTISGLLLTAMWLAADSGAGISWTVPAGWKADAGQQARFGTYRVPPGGECGIYYFGAGQGGTVEANLDRWIGQFMQADGKPAKSEAKIAKRTIHSWPVTTLDVSGAYTGIVGPLVRSGVSATPGYRMLAAVVEGPQGSVFIKFIGPAKTVAANQAAFDKMLASLGPVR